MRRTGGESRTRGGAVAATAILATASVLAGCVVTAQQGEPLGAEVERPISLSVGVEAGAELVVENLAGVLVVEGHEGSSLELEGTVHGGGDDEAEARQLADRIELEVDDNGDRVAVRVRYPVEDYERFHYPDAAGGVAVFGLFGVNDTSLDYQGRRVSVSSRRTAGSASVWAELRLRIPSGLDSRLEVGVGRIDATDIDGDVLLEIHSGSVSAVGGRGRMVAHTGSGSVDLEDRDGDVAADTGSGKVTIRGVRGDVRADTGSGAVAIRDVEAGSIDVDTGSGGVDLENASGNLLLDTGSGAIRGRGLRAGERVYADTGSGGVRLSGDFRRSRRIEIDTGSGGVELEMASWPSMTLRLSTGSGGIDVDLPDLVVERDRDGLFLGRVGDEQEAKVTVETGSGGIRLRRR